MKGEKLKRILFKGDKTIWIVFFTLCAISWVEVFSATSRQTYETGSYWGPIIKHSCFLAGGIFIAWLIHTLKAKWIDRLSGGIYWIGLIGLVWAQVQGAKINDSARWISIMGMTFQPMEFAKMGIVMMTARILAKYHNGEALANTKGIRLANRIYTQIMGIFKKNPKKEFINNDNAAFWRIFICTIVPTAIIFKENFSSAALLIFTVFFMMFIGRIPRRQLLKAIGCAGAIVAVGGIIIWECPQALYPVVGESKAKTWHNRFEEAINPKPVTAEEYDMDKNAQKTYSHIAIASSNILGCGPGNSIQRDFIPHAYSDFIFAVVIEELGLLGAAFVILLYLTLLFRSGKIAKRCEDPYPAFLSMGIGMIIVMQALLHMYISVGDFVTGQPLPLMSQGGTSVIINCVYIGFLLSISQYANQEEKKIV